LRLCALPQKNLLFFALSCARQYPTVTATSHRGSSMRFDSDIGHVIIDTSLVCCCVATRGRGCRPQRINLRRNKLTRGHIAPASTASSNAPTPIPLARGHLILDGQPPIRVHRCGGGGGLCRQTREVILFSIINSMLTPSSSIPRSLNLQIRQVDDCWQLRRLGNSVAAAVAARRQHGSCSSLVAVWRQVRTTATTTTMTKTNTTIKQCTGEGGG
jgi:hypothetical protein